MTASILVTGASGKTGRAVVGATARAGLDVRALVRPGRSDPTVGAAAGGGTARPGSVEIVEGDLDTGAGLAEAMRGCDAVYLIAPNFHLDEPSVVGRVLAAAQVSGVERVVYHSVLHPYAPMMPHHVGKAAGEDLVRRSGLTWTVLQPCAYVQNIVTGERPAEIVMPYSVDSRFSLVDLDDVAAAASVVLTGTAHRGATYELCGPDAVSVAELAGFVDVMVREIGVEEWRAGPGASVPGPVRDGLAAMFGYYDRHGLVGNGHVLRWLLGREPRGVADFVTAAWRRRA